MKKTILKIICSLTALLFVVSASAFAALPNENEAAEAPITVNTFTVDQNSEIVDSIVEEALDTKQTLRFNENGKLKILVFSDLQEGDPSKTENGTLLREDTLSYMNRMLDEQKPDLVLFTGDNHCGRISTKAAMNQYLRQMAEPMESRQIPWAQVYGNHAEGGYNYKMPCGVSKAEQQKIFESFTYNVSKAGNVSGQGNYVIPVLRSDSDKIGYNVFCFDSHDYIYKYGDHVYGDGFEEEAIPGKIYSGNVYDVIHFDQIKWYWDTSVALEDYNGATIPAMMMFHIPLYEMTYITQNKRPTGFNGQNNDPVSAPEINSGLFWALYERGDVKTIINGHDHLNTFQGTYMGVTMAYAGSIGGVEYNNDRSKGARIVEINQDDAFNVETYMIYVKDLK